MQTIRRNPSDGIYAASPDYVHALEIRGHSRTLYVSGTMGLDQDGKAGVDLDEQLTLIWNNIRRILAEADMTTENIVRLASYLRDPSYAEANQKARMVALGSHRVPTTALIAQTLREDWLVEIEVIAAA
jgi:2-iminobutanoate/2-iminopropanoate deaminase